MNARRLARLNHVLVPDTSRGRDRFRRRPFGRVVMFLFAGYQRFSREAQPFLVLAMASGLFALDVLRSQLFVAWGALSGLLTASLVCSLFYGLRGVTLRAQVPRRVALGSRTRIGLVLENAAASPAGRPFHSLRVFGPFLPWDGEWHEKHASLAVLEPGARVRVELEASFHRRGEHQLDPFSVQALVPLGLAMGAPVLSEAPHFLVVPQVARIDSLTLPRTRRHHAGGVPRAVHTADSRELAGVRPYRPGDAVRDLHVRTWARTGVPHVREYQEEYFSHLAVLVDAGARSEDERSTRDRSAPRWWRLPRRGDRGEAAAVEDPPLEAALAVAAGVLAKMLGGEALVDLLVVGEETGATKLGRGRGTLDAALDRLAAVTRSDPVDVAREVARIVAERDRLSGVIVVCSAWDERRADLVKKLEAEALAPLVIVCAEGSVDALPANVRALVAKSVLAGERISL